MAEDFSLLVKHLERVAKNSATFHIGWEDEKQADIAKTLHYGAREAMVYRSKHGGKLMMVKGIPPRPFLKDAWKMKRDDVAQTAKSFYTDAIRDNVDHSKTGRRFVAIVQDFIETETIYQPNSVRVEDDKGSDIPLIDTGHMKNTLTYGVE